eukprot:jgi/Tetstr1/423434/TSEL_014115.t1
MGLRGGFCAAIGLAPEDRQYFTVNYRGKLYRLAGLPMMGWSLSPYYIYSLTAAFSRHVRRPDFAVTSQGPTRCATVSVTFVLGRLERLKDSWSGRVKTTHQLRRDLEWRAAVPNHSNGRSIYKPVETAYMHVVSSGYYGWGAVFNETAEAHGLCRHVLLHEDNMRWSTHVLANLTSRSPLLMMERRKP